MLPTDPNHPTSKVKSVMTEEYQSWVTVTDEEIQSLWGEHLRTGPLCVTLHYPDKDRLDSAVLLFSVSRNGQVLGPGYEDTILVPITYDNKIESLSDHLKDMAEREYMGPLEIDLAGRLFVLEYAVWDALESVLDHMYFYWRLNELRVYHRVH